MWATKFSTSVLAIKKNYHLFYQIFLFVWSDLVKQMPGGASKSKDKDALTSVCGVCTLM